MKTRFTPLVKMKKDLMERCERDLTQANQNLQNARISLEEAYTELKSFVTPTSGNISALLMSQMKVESQRAVIAQKQEWIAYAQRQVDEAQRRFREAMVEYEKFNYLEAEQIKAGLAEQKRREQLELDEIAVFGYMRKGEGQ